MGRNSQNNHRGALHNSIDYTGRNPHEELAVYERESPLVGLPKRGKHVMGDQIYNYDSIYNVFGRHYTHRYVSKTPAPKFNFQGTPASQQDYISQQARFSEGRSSSISPGRLARPERIDASLDNSREELQNGNIGGGGVGYGS